MSAERRPEVTEAKVCRLCDEAAHTSNDQSSVHDWARARLDQVNSENPVVT
jgi:hypothetical protein